ncbi:hypothetical protein FOG50_02369 [Hanseniaspora uvarum]|nr:hypothetical protein FOG48_00355 [Hanseniaspora uvarum]KAF0276757.1 hypothetical protein FOG50_02369 [Hanseniaspora uvarum]
MSDIENEDINFADLVSNILLNTEAQENENNSTDGEQTNHEANDNGENNALTLDEEPMNQNHLARKDSIQNDNNYQEWVDMIHNENNKRNNEGKNNNNDSQVNNNANEEDDAFLTNAILNSLQSMAIEHPQMNDAHEEDQGSGVENVVDLQQDHLDDNNNSQLDDGLLDADRLNYFNNGKISHSQQEAINNDPEDEMDNIKLVDDILNYILGDDDKKGSKKKKSKSKKVKAIETSKESKQPKAKKDSKKKKKSVSAEDDLQALINQVVSSTLEEHSKQAKKPKAKKKSTSVEPSSISNLNTQGGVTSTLQFPDITSPPLQTQGLAPKKDVPSKPQPVAVVPTIEAPSAEVIVPKPVKEPIYIPPEPKIKKKSDKKKREKEALKKKKNDELDLAQIMKDAMSLAKTADAEKKAKEKERKEKEKQKEKEKIKLKQKEKAKLREKAKLTAKAKALAKAESKALAKAEAKALLKAKKKEKAKTKPETKVKASVKKPPASVDSMQRIISYNKKLKPTTVKVTNVFKNSTIGQREDGPAMITSKTSSNAFIDKSKLVPKKTSSKVKPFSKADIEGMKIFMKTGDDPKILLQQQKKREAKALRKLKKEAKLKKEKEEKAKQKKLKEEAKALKLKELEKQKQEKLAHRLQQREIREQQLALKKLEKENNKKLKEAEKKSLMFEKQRNKEGSGIRDKAMNNGFSRLSVKNLSNDSKPGANIVFSDANKFLNSRYTTIKPGNMLQSEVMMKAGIWEKYKTARNDLLAELKKKGEDRPLKKKEEARILKQVKKAHAKEVQERQRQMTKERKRIEKEDTRKLRERENARRIEYMKSLDSDGNKTIKVIKPDNATEKGFIASEVDSNGKVVAIPENESLAVHEDIIDFDHYQKDIKNIPSLSYVPVDPSILTEKNTVISKNSLRLIPVVLKGPPFPYYLKLDDLGIPKLPLAKNNMKSSARRMSEFEVKGKIDVFGRNVNVWERYKIENPQDHNQKYNDMIKNVQANLLKHLGAMSSFDLDLGSIEQGYVINWDMQYKAHPPFQIPEVPVFSYGESVINTAKYGNVSIFWLYEQTDSVLDEIFSHEKQSGLSIETLRLKNFNNELIKQKIDRKPFETYKKVTFQQKKSNSGDSKKHLYYSNANKSTFDSSKPGSDMSHLGTIIKHFDVIDIPKRKRDEVETDVSNLKIIQLNEGKIRRHSKDANGKRNSTGSTKIKKTKRFQAPNSTIVKIPRHPDTLFDNINQKLFCILKTLVKAPTGYVKSYEEVTLLKNPEFKPIKHVISEDLQNKIDEQIDLVIRKFKKFYSRIDNECIEAYSTIIRSYTIFYLVWYAGLITDIGRHFGKVVKNYTKLFNVDKVVLGIRDILKDLDKQNLRRKTVSNDETLKENNDLTEIFDFILGRVEKKLKLGFFMPFIKHRNDNAMAETIDAQGNAITIDDTNKKRVNKYLLLSILFAVMDDCIQFILAELPENVRNVIADSNLELQDAVSVISKEMVNFVAPAVKYKKRSYLDTTANDGSILPASQRVFKSGNDSEYAKNLPLEGNVVMLKKRRKLGHNVDDFTASPLKQETAKEVVENTNDSIDGPVINNSTETSDPPKLIEPVSIDKFTPGYEFGFGKVNQKSYEQLTDINPLVKSKIDVIWEMFFKYEFNIPPRSRLLRNKVLMKRIQMKVSTEVYKKFEQEYKTERMRRYRALKAEKEMEDIKDIKSYIAKSPLKSQLITKSQMDRVRGMKGMNGKLVDNDLLNMLAFIQGNNLTLIKDILDDMENDCNEPVKRIKVEKNEESLVSKNNAGRSRTIKEEVEETINKDDEEKPAEVIDFTNEKDDTLLKTTENPPTENIVNKEEDVVVKNSESKEVSNVENKEEQTKEPLLEKEVDDPSVDPQLQ